MSFNEDEFDAKVARSIVNIHKKEQDYSKWVNNNYEHLENLFHLSKASVPFDNFSSFVYDHSK